MKKEQFLLVLLQAYCQEQPANTSEPTNLAENLRIYVISALASHEAVVPGDTTKLIDGIRCVNGENTQLVMEILGAVSQDEINGARVSMKKWEGIRKRY